LENAKTLFIDEISMVSADLLDKIDIILRKIRSKDKPFGDMRLILVGDIFQLQAYWQANRLNGKNISQYE
jgi:ATP-dependent exoDNAse (exonuclease V) alpha subunit